MKRGREACRCAAAAACRRTSRPRCATCARASTRRAIAAAERLATARARRASPRRCRACSRSPKTSTRACAPRPCARCKSSATARRLPRAARAARRRRSAGARARGGRARPHRRRRAPAMRCGRALRSPHPEVRFQAPLSYLEACAEPQLSALTPLMRDEDPKVRANTARCLAQFGDDARAELRRALADADAGVRAEAALALARAGRRAGRRTRSRRRSLIPSSSVEVLDAIGTLRSAARCAPRWRRSPRACFKPLRAEGRGRARAGPARRCARRPSAARGAARVPQRRPQLRGAGRRASSSVHELVAGAGAPGAPACAAPTPRCWSRRWPRCCRGRAARARGLALLARRSDAAGERRGPPLDAQKGGRSVGCRRPDRSVFQHSPRQAFQID